MDLCISDIQLHPEYLKASVNIYTTSPWRPNDKKDRIKLISSNEAASAMIFSPAISDVEDNHFNIRVDVELSQDKEYKLVYLDETNTKRGASSTFTYPCGDVDSAPSLQSSDGSFEAVSDDDENSFTIINAESLAISKDWEITAGSSSTDSETEDSDGSENCDQLCPLTDRQEKDRSPTLLMTSATNIPPGSKSPFNDETVKLPDDIQPNETKQLDVLSPSKKVLLEIEKEQEEESVLPCNEIMSKSVVLGPEHLSQSEVKSLQNRNRSHFKKINKLSELLDNEKKVSAELLETVMEKTEQNVELLKTIEKLRSDLHDSQKKLRKADKDNARLRNANESMQKQLLEQKKRDEQVLPQIKKFGSWKKHSSSTKSNNDSKRQDSDRMCDIAIVRPRRHGHREGQDRDKHHKERSDLSHQVRSRHSPHRHEQSSDEKYTAQAGSDQSQIIENFLCPVCERLMPSSLSERERTVHVESCLQKREA